MRRLGLLLALVPLLAFGQGYQPCGSGGQCTASSITVTAGSGSGITILNSGVSIKFGDGTTQSTAATGTISNAASGRVAVYSGTNTIAGYTGLTSDSSGNLSSNSLLLPNNGQIDVPASTNVLQLGHKTATEYVWIGAGSNGPSSTFPVAINQPFVVTGTNGNVVWEATNNVDSTLAAKVIGSSEFQFGTDSNGRWFTLASDNFSDVAAIKAGHMLIHTTTDDGSGSQLQINGSVNIDGATSSLAFSGSGPSITTTATNAPLSITPNGSGKVLVKDGNYFCLDGATAAVCAYDQGEWKFSGSVSIGGGTIDNDDRLNSNTGSSMTLTTARPDGTGATADFIINNNTTQSTAGDLLVSVKNNGTLESSIDYRGYIASTTPHYYSVFTGTGVLTNGGTLGEQVLPSGDAMTITAVQWRVSTAGSGGTTGLVLSASDGTNTCTSTATTCNATGNQRKTAVNGAGTGCAFPAAASITYTVAAASDCAVYPIFLGVANVEEKWQ